MSSVFTKVNNNFKCSKLGIYLRKARLNRVILREDAINKDITKYRGNISAEERQKLFDDIVNMAKKYRFSAEEYFYYHFEDKSEEERKTFISDLNRIVFCDTLNTLDNLAVFNDKGKSAKIFGAYYGRDYLSVRGTEDISNLKSFVQKHKKLIVKPLVGSRGAGIQVLKKDWTEDEISALIGQYCSDGKGGFIVEELVVQSLETAQFHPSSLNTIRVATVRFDEGAEVIAAFFRTGRGGSVVDNAGAGGLFGTIDVKTGVIDAVGDEFGRLYEEHPESKIKMIGFTIPRWNEAVELAKELATVLPDNRYTGWDLALTENGWVMIEGNARGQFVWQIPRQKGYLKETNEILKKLGFAEMKKLSM